MFGKRKKRKTGTQIAQELTESITIKVISISKSSLPVRAICKACIVIFSFSICFGIYGLGSRYNDISKREQSVEKLKNEMKELEKSLEIKLELKEKLISDTLTIEAVARSYGMSKKGENIFYFLD